MPTPSLLKGESLLNKFNELDQYDFEEGKIPLIYDPKEVDGVVPHQDFFEVMNKQIASINPSAKPIDFKTPIYRTEDMKDLPEFQRYRMIIGDIASKEPFFEALSPVHQKRIVDYNALQATALHTMVKDRIPDDLDNKSKQELYNTYNRYFEQNYLPAIKQTTDSYSEMHIRDASNDNLKIAFANTLASAVEGLGTITEKFSFGMIDDKWAEENAESIREWTKDYRQGTGVFALNEDEVRRLHGSGLDLGFMTTGTFKHGYALNKVMEGIVQQGVQGIAPFVGGVAGTAIGGPLGAATGIGIGLGAGAVIEAGSFEDEMRERYTSLREQALLSRKMVESGTMTEAEFLSKFSIDIGEQIDGENVMITADMLSDQKIEEITENLSLSYAGFSSMVEGAGTVLSLAGGPLAGKALSKLTSRFMASKVGQKAGANTVFKTIKKPLAPTPAIIGEMVQEGTVEGIQEDINMTLMRPYMADYNRLTEEQQQERIKSARFLGAVIGGGMRAGSQIIGKGADVIGQLKNKKIDQKLKGDILNEYDTNRILEGDVSAEITESRSKNELYIKENGFQTDLAVQVASAIDPLVDKYRDTIAELSDDPQRTDELIAVRRKFNSETLNALPELLMEAKKKGVLANLGLSANDFVDFISPQNLKKVFGKEAQKEIKQRANAFNVTDELLATQYSDQNELNLVEHTPNKKMGELTNLYNKLSLVKNKTQKQKKKLKELSNQISELKGIRKKRRDIRNIPNDTGELQSLSESDPATINSLKPIKELTHIDNDTKAYLKLPKNLIYLRVGNKVLKQNPKTGKKETAFIGYPVFHQLQPGQEKPQLGFTKITVFEKDIKMGLLKKPDKDGKKRWSMPVKESPKQKPVLTVKKTEEVKEKTVEKPNLIKEAENLNGKQLSQKLKEAGVKGRSKLTTVKQKREAYKDYLIKESVSVTPTTPVKTVNKLPYQNIAKNNKLGKFLANALLKTDVEIKIDPNLNVAGKYNSKTNTITLQSEENTAENRQTAVHEMVHALTSQVLKDFDNGQLSKKDPRYSSVVSLNKLFKKVQNQLGKEEKESIKKLEKFIKDYKQGVELTDAELFEAQQLREQFYAFSNVREFVAELMTNPSFQERLKKFKIPNKQTTLFEKFKELITNILGIKKQDTALYQGALNVIDIISQPSLPKGKKIKPILTAVKDNASLQAGLLAAAEGDPNVNFLTDNIETISVQNVIDDLVNDDFVADEDADVNFLIRWGRTKGILSKQDKNRVYKAFEHLWLSVYSKYDLPISYYPHWENNVSNFLEGTPIQKHFKEWSKNYKVDNLNSADMIGMFSKQNTEDVFESSTKGDASFDAILGDIKSAFDYTEEFIRQGIGINEEGRLEGDTKSNNFAKIDMSFFKEIGLNPTNEQEILLKKIIQEEDSIEGFIEQVSDDEWIQQNKFYLDRGLTLKEALSLDTKGFAEQALTRYFVSNKRINRTPTGRGKKQKDAVKSLYAFFKSGKAADGSQKTPPRFDFKVKDKPRIFYTGQKEPQLLYKNIPDKMRTRAVERNFDPKDLVYISIDDLWGFAPPSVDAKGNLNWNNGVKNIRAETKHYKALIRSALKQRVVPLLVRGDGKLIPMVKITGEHIRLASGKNAQIYWGQELSQVPEGINPKTNRPYREEVTENWISGYISNSPQNVQSNASEEYTGLRGHQADSYFNASNIARHEAYKEIYGDDYWIHLNSHKLLHRAKIPFGVGNANPNMPNKKLVQFDPRTDLGEQSKSKVVHTFNNGMKSEINLVQKLDKQFQYIWDGQTITSEKVHAKEYVKHHGTNPKGRRAKTFFYHRGETGVIAQKHQEMSWYMQDNAVKSEIFDGEGNLVATIKKDIDGFINIQDKNGDYIDYLSTPDETKITTGEYAGVFNEPIELDGSSINLIMYPRENDKSQGKIFKQLFNYFPDEKMQRLIRGLYNDNDPRKKFSPVQLFNRLKTLVKDPKAIDEYKLQYSRATIDGLPLPMARNALVNVGFHPSESGTNANIVKNGIIKEINDFKNYGTKLDFRMDNTGTIDNDQLVMPYDHKVANNIRNMMKKKDATKEQINNWLSNNDVWVLVTRSPVPSRFGYRMMKVKSLENIGDTFIVNPKVVKEVFEADGDGDTASIVFIEPKHKELRDELIKRQEIAEGLNLQPSETAELDVSTYDGLADAMFQMSVGKNAVGEIGNVARNLGIIKTWFKSLEFKDQDGKTRATLKMRNFSDKVYDADMDETNTIEHFIRKYMQAGADHAKLLKLQDWNYSQRKLYSMMFYFKEDPMAAIDDGDYDTLKYALIEPINESHSVVSGMTFEKDLGFKEYIEKSQGYMNYIENRRNVDIIRDDNFEATLKGKGHPTHLAEDMIIGIGNHANDNNYDGDVFNTDHATAMFLHTQTIKEFSDQWGEDQVNLLLEEDGIDVKNLTIEQKRSQFVPYMKKAQKITGEAQAFYSELRNKLRSKSLAENVDDETKIRSESSNIFVFDKRAAEVYEKWTSLLEARNYTPAMRKIFTQAYLTDVGNLSKRGSSVDRNKLYIPPTDPKNPNSILDPSIMQDYYKRFNEKRLKKDFDNKLAPMTNAYQNLKRSFEKLGCIV